MNYFNDILLILVYYIILINKFFLFILNFCQNHFFLVTFFLINFIIFIFYKYNTDFKNNLKKNLSLLFLNRISPICIYYFFILREKINFKIIYLINLFFNKK
jgi:hypothetical protein